MRCSIKNLAFLSKLKIESQGKRGLGIPKKMKNTCRTVPMQIGLYSFLGITCHLFWLQGAVFGDLNTFFRYVLLTSESQIGLLFVKYVQQKNREGMWFNSDKKSSSCFSHLQKKKGIRKKNTGMTRKSMSIIVVLKNVDSLKFHSSKIAKPKQIFSFQTHYSSLQTPKPLGSCQATRVRNDCPKPWLFLDLRFASSCDDQDLHWNSLLW